MTLVLTRATKQAARYTDAGGRERCSGCRFFMPQGTCGRIIGPVSPRGWCKYYSMEMVQRSQPGSVLGSFGGASGVTLDIGFTNPGQPIDPRITFTRASTATYFDSTGTIQTAATNAPRFDYDPGTHLPSGLLIEEQRQNIMFPSTNWLAAQAPTGAVDGVAQNAGAGLAGANNAMAIIGGSFAGAHQWYVSFAGAASTQYTCSVFAKAAGNPLFLLFMQGTSFASPQVATFNLQTGVVVNQPANGSARISSAGGGWYRCSVMDTSGTGAPSFLATAASTPNGNLSYTGDSVSGAWVWGLQVEAGAFATSYIPTTAAAVTRSVDTCSILPAQMGFYVPSGGSWAAEFINQDTTATASFVIGQRAASGVPTPMYIDATLHLSQWDTIALVATANASATGVVTKGATAWSVGAAKDCLNGGAVVSTAAMTLGYPALGTNGAGFLTSSTVTTEFMTGYIRRVRYWPRVLSDTEMQSVTT